MDREKRKVHQRVMREARERVDLADMKIDEGTVETARRHSECRGATASFEMKLESRASEDEYKREEDDQKKEWERSRDKHGITGGLSKKSSCKKKIRDFEIRPCVVWKNDLSTESRKAHRSYSIFGRGGFCWRTQRRFAGFLQTPA